MTATAAPALQEEASDVLARYTSEMARFKAMRTGAEDFDHQPSHVYIVSFPKSGTTLGQQLLYQLFAATGRIPSDPSGENFDSIYQVFPTIGLRRALGMHTSIHAYSPRMWKSHGTIAEFDFVPVGEGRFVYCVRDGLDVARSYIDFTLDWILHKDPVKGEELRAEVYRQWFLSYFLGLRRCPDGTFEPDGDHNYLRDWFSHVKGWLNVRRPNVFYLIYEDVLHDLPKAVREVADFLSLDISPEVVNRVAKKCDRETMAKDPRFVDRQCTELMGWDPNGGIKVRPSGLPGFKDVQLPAECMDVYNQMFVDSFGVKTYEELLPLLRAKNLDLKSS